MRCVAPRRFGKRCTGTVDRAAGACTSCGASAAAAERFLRDAREAAISAAVADPPGDVDWAKLAKHRAVCLLDGRVPARLMFVPIVGVRSSASRSRWKVQLTSGKFLSVAPERVVAIKPSRVAGVLAYLVLVPRWKDSPDHLDNPSIPVA